jgi:hypothetical protein
VNLICASLAIANFGYAYYRMNFIASAPPFPPSSVHPVALVYAEETEPPTYQVEMVDAVREEGGYRLASIPFFAKHIALNDVIAVETHEGVHYFEELLHASGHSVIRVLFSADLERKSGTAALEQLGAVAFRYADSLLVAFDVPPHVDYAPIQHFLASGEKQQQWDYQEACLGWKTLYSG